MATAIAEQTEVVSDVLSARLKLYLKISDETDAMDAALKEQKKKRDQLEESIVEQMAVEDVQSVNVDGRLCYRITNRHCSFKQEVKDTPSLMDRAFRAIAAMGASGIIKRSINSSTLRAWVNEQAEAREDKAVPPKLLKFLDVYEDFTLGVRKTK
jgi:predicted transcriptional regulator